MQRRLSESVCVATFGNEIFNEQCPLDGKPNENWQELQQFWNPKMRVQEFNRQNSIPCGLENHLNNHYINGIPWEISSKDLNEDLKSVVVSGKDICDIPTSYEAIGFKPEELIVIGTFVDKNIVPGFKYKVRKNLTDEYLFDGKSLHLESIGLGYGKRLTFQSETLNENKNFFWSDSRTHGYGFTFQPIEQDDIFRIKDISNGQTVGKVTVNNPSVDINLELSTVVQEHGEVQKEVRVQFSCDVTLSDSCNKQNIFVENVTVTGVAIVTRKDTASRAKVEKIIVHDFIIENCELLTEE
ncbi:uncharacterized protein LOC129229443 [Uloborus diversus]|uniref:uncharacterized protein LOC129229443 n=1 Tax=Uloborus diversus TaxID=327109 RepID=UPI0024091CE7|nr:uncharacterized protein LOC129229443 [Uloborus diversus]